MPKLILASFSLLLLTNVIVLAGVAYNRSGEPLVNIVLTERELPVQQSYKSTDENSGTALTLKWHIFNPDEDIKYLHMNYITPTWLDDEKLTALGFDMKTIKSNSKDYSYSTSFLSSDAVVVLEYQGEAHDRTIVIAENKAERLRKDAAEFPEDEKKQDELKDFEKLLTQLKVSHSRLYAVDAGLDKEVLIEKYADKNKYLFVRGEIGLSWNNKTVEGRIKQLYAKNIHAPLPFSNTLSAFNSGDRYNSYSRKSIPPRYNVQLKLGKRLEPWITSVTQM